mgnify:CR=1 FL=1
MANRLVEIPPAIGNLRELQMLGLKDNKLTHLPDEIGLLHKLVGLFLSGNLIERLPETIEVSETYEDVSDK